MVAMVQVKLATVAMMVAREVIDVVVVVTMVTTIDMVVVMLLR